MPPAPPGPFSHYLFTHPSAPTHDAMRCPATCNGLWEAAGQPGRRAHYNDTYWDFMLTRWPLLATWLEGGKAFVAPEQWPTLIQQVWDEHLWGRPPSPYQLALDFLPTADAVRRRSPLYHVEGRQHLAAVAHGWPVLPWEVERAAEALRELLSHKQFYIWARCPDLSSVPLPVERPRGKGNRGTTLDYLYKQESRNLLWTDPLAMGSTRLAWALPPLWTKEHLDRLPQIPWVPRSSRWPMVLPPGT